MPVIYRDDGSVAWGMLAIFTIVALAVLMVGYFAWYRPAVEPAGPNVVVTPSTPPPAPAPNVNVAPAPAPNVNVTTPAPAPAPDVNVKTDAPTVNVNPPPGGDTSSGGSSPSGNP
jgi:hypothetical protein